MDIRRLLIFIAGGTGAVSSAPPTLALGQLSLTHSPQHNQLQLKLQSGEVCNSFEDVPHHYVTYCTASEMFADGSAALIESDPATNLLDNVILTTGVISPTQQLQLDVGGHKTVTPVSLTISSAVDNAFQQDSDAKKLSKPSYAFSDSPHLHVLHGSPSIALQCSPRYSTPFGAIVRSEGNFAELRKLQYPVRQTPHHWSPLYLSTDPGCTVNLSSGNITTSPQLSVSHRHKRKHTGTGHGCSSKRLKHGAYQPFPTSDSVPLNVLPKHRKGRLKKRKEVRKGEQDMSVHYTLCSPFSNGGDKSVPSSTKHLHGQKEVALDVAAQTHSFQVLVTPPMSGRKQKTGKKSKAVHPKHMPKDHLASADPQDLRIKPPCRAARVDGFHNVLDENARGNPNAQEPSDPTDLGRPAARNGAQPSDTSLSHPEDRCARSGTDFDGNMSKMQSIQAGVPALEARILSEAQERPDDTVQAVTFVQEVDVTKAESCVDDDEIHARAVNTEPPAAGTEVRSLGTPLESNKKPPLRPGPRMASQIPLNQHIEAEPPSEAKTPVQVMPTAPKVCYQEGVKHSSSTNQEHPDPQDQVLQQECLKNSAQQKSSTLVTEFKRAARQHQQHVPVAHAGDLDKAGRIRMPSTGTCSGSVPTSVSLQNLVDGRVVGQVSFLRTILSSC